MEREAQGRAHGACHWHSTSPPATAPLSLLNVILLPQRDAVYEKWREGTALACSTRCLFIPFLRLVRVLARLVECQCWAVLNCGCRTQELPAHNQQSGNLFSGTSSSSSTSTSTSRSLVASCCISRFFQPFKINSAFARLFAIPNRHLQLNVQP